MHPDPASGTIIYRTGMNPKIRRSFEIFTPCDFIAAITQHIPDKSFQLVRYYGWYSNKMRGQRSKQSETEERAVEPSGLGVGAATALFFESNSRFVISVAPEKAADLEALFVGLPIAKIGTVTAEKKLMVNGAVNVDGDALVKPFKETLHGV